MGRQLFGWFSFEQPKESCFENFSIKVKK